jgi:hypothetical protein
MVRDSGSIPAWLTSSNLLIRNDRNYDLKQLIEPQASSVVRSPSGDRIGSSQVGHMATITDICE